MEGRNSPRVCVRVCLSTLTALLGLRTQPAGTPLQHQHVTEYAELSQNPQTSSRLDPFPKF